MKTKFTRGLALAAASLSLLAPVSRSQTFTPNALGNEPAQTAVPNESWPEWLKRADAYRAPGARKSWREWLRDGTQRSGPADWTAWSWENLLATFVLPELINAEGHGTRERGVVTPGDAGGPKAPVHSSPNSSAGREATLPEPLGYYASFLQEWSVQSPSLDCVFASRDKGALSTSAAVESGAPSFTFGSVAGLDFVRNGHSPDAVTANLNVDGSNSGANSPYTFSSGTSTGGLINYWNTNANGTWSNPANWTAGVPNAVGASASFGGGGTAITAARTVTVDGAFTVGTLGFNSAQAFTLTAGAGGAITLDNGATTSFVSDTAGSHNIGVPLVMTANGATFQVSGAADTLNVMGVVSGSGTALTKTGAGTLTLTAQNTFTGGTTVNAGSLILGNGSGSASLTGNSPGGYNGVPGGVAVTVKSGASLQVQTNASVSGGAGAVSPDVAGSGGTAVSVFGSGSLLNSGTIQGGRGGDGFHDAAAGGAGVTFAGSGGTLTNSGTITGGNGGIPIAGGTDGSAGSGVVFSGGAGTLTNKKGGTINNGAVMGNYANNVTLEIGSSITGGLYIGTSNQSMLTLTDDGTGGSATYSSVVSGSTAFAGSLIKNGGGAWTYDLALSNIATVNAGTLTLSGSGDNAGLGATVNGGSLVLAKASASGVHAIGSGGLTILGGEVHLGGTGDDQIFDGATVTMNGGYLGLDGHSETFATLNGSGGVISTPSGSPTLTVSSGSFAGTINYMSVHKIGSGTLTLSGTADNVSLGATVSDGTLVLAKTSGTGPDVHAIGYGVVVEGGTLQLGGTGGDQIYDGAFVTVNGGAFDLNGRSETISSLNGTGGAISSPNGASVLTVGSGSFAGTISNMSIHKTSTGTLTLSGTADNVSLGATVNDGTLVLAKTSGTGPDVHAIGYGVIVNGGTLQLGGTGGDQIYDGAFVTLNGGTFDLNGRSETINGLSGSAGTISNSAAGTTSTLSAANGSFGGTIANGAGQTALAKYSSGTLTLTAQNTFTGGTTVNAGTLVLGNGSNAASLLGQNGAGGNPGGSGTAAVSVNSTAALTLKANASVTGGTGGFNNNVSGASAGPGASGAVFSGAGTLDNAGSINGGAGGAALRGFGGTGGTAVVFLAGGASFSNSATGLIVGGAGGNSSQPSSDPGDAGNAGDGVDFKGSGTWSNAGMIKGGAGGSQTDSSSKRAGNAGSAVLLEGGGSFTNNGTLTGGTGGKSDSPGAGGTGIRALNTSAGIVNTGMIMGGTGGAAYAENGATGGNGVFFGAGGSLTNSGTISGGAGGARGFLSGRVNGASGSGVVFSGAAGTLVNQNSGVINNGVAMGIFANSVTLQIGSTINGNLNVGTNAGSTLTLTDNGNGGSQLYSSAVTGTTTFAGALIKNGAGTWNLDRAMSYSGGTNVNAGTLLVDNITGSGTGTGAVAVNSNATLGGNGTIAGPVTVNNSGTLAPGNSAGTLHLGSDLTLNNGANLAIQIGGLTAGSGYDQVQLAGALTLNTPNLVISLINGFTPALNDKFYIVDLSSATLATGVVGNAIGGTVTDSSGNNYLINYFDTYMGSTPGNDISLTYLGMVPVPEPSTWAAAALALLALARTRRRATARKTRSSG